MFITWFLGFFALLFVGIYFLFKYITGNKGYWPKHNVPYLDMNTIAPFFDRITFKIPLQELDKMMYQGFKKMGCRNFGGITEFRTPTVVAMDLDLIKAITVKDFDHFVNRRGLNMKKSDPIFHEMLINKENQEWKDLRATMSPTFTTGKIKRMFQVFNESGDKLAKFLDEESAKGGEDGVDFRDGATRFTMDVIASAAFGFDSQVFKGDDSLFFSWGRRFQDQFKGIKMIKFVLAMIAPKVMDYLKIPITDQEAVNFFAGVIRETIKRREESGEKRDDFIQLMLEAKSGELGTEEISDAYEKDSQLKGKTGKIALTNDLILSQALLFFSAGFDTTETLLIFALYELALNQEIQVELHREIDETVENNGGELSYEAINRMEYLDKVISETLRKYPPAIRSERKCTQDYKLPNSDYVLKKGQVVILPMYGIHHDEEYFPNPDKFDPERFSPEAKAARHAYAYFPFGTGPRNCIAMRFALIEGKAALAHLMHKFRVEPSRKTAIPPKFGKSIGFKPDGGMWLKVTRREQN